MSIKFSVYKTPRPKGSKDNLEHARLVSRGTKGLEEICRDLSDACTVNSADIKGVLEALTVYMGRELGYGYSIELEGIGHFSRRCVPGKFLRKTEKSGLVFLSTG